MKTIPLTKGKEVLVDDLDHEFLTCIKWHACRDGRQFYAQNADFGRMHQLLKVHDKPMEVDHIDGNGLNNQRSNLRVVTHQQNNWNMAKKRTVNGISPSSTYKGVSKSTGRRHWTVKIKVSGKSIYLGTFLDEIEAAKCYDDAARKYFGEFSYTNFKKG